MMTILVPQTRMPLGCIDVEVVPVVCPFLKRCRAEHESALLQLSQPPTLFRQHWRQWVI